MANGNNPVSGTDTNGLTAMLNSLVKLDRQLRRCSAEYQAFPEWFRSNAAVKSILKTYFERWYQAMITVVNKYDLESHAGT